MDPLKYEDEQVECDMMADSNGCLGIMGAVVGMCVLGAIWCVIYLAKHNWQMPF